MTLVVGANAEDNVMAGTVESVRGECEDVEDVYPLSSKQSMQCAAMKPEPPVKSTFILYRLYLEKRSAQIHLSLFALMNYKSELSNTGAQESLGKG